MADIGSLVASIGLAHMVGDYVIQSHWMAVEKTIVAAATATGRVDA